MWAAFWGALSAFFVAVVPQVLMRAAIGLGFAVLTYPLMDSILDTVRSAILMELSSVPAGIVGLLGILRLDDAISVIFSSYAFRLAVLKLTPSKLVYRLPGQ